MVSRNLKHGLMHAERVPDGIVDTSLSDHADHGAVAPSRHVEVPSPPGASHTVDHHAVATDVPEAHPADGTKGE